MACKYYINGLTLSKDEFLNYVKKQPLEESAKVLSITATPSAPFITDTNKYVSLGLKVALKEAVKQGAEKIAWTTGEQQNERYDLSKQVQSISYEKKSKEFSSKAQEKGQDLYSLYIETKESGYEQFDDLTISEVEGYVGKDIANKIQNNEGNKENLDTSKGNKKVNKLTGIDLKVGGKGMKGFYGSPTEGSLGIVGNVAKSLFKQEPKTVEIEVGNSQVDLDTPPRVIKLKSGEYVVQTPFNDSYVMVDGEMENPTFKDLSSAKEFYINETNRYNKEIEKTKTSTQHSIDITPELKAEVEKGLPLFMRTPNGKILGFAHEGKVYLNGEKINANTPIHEAGHIWTEWAKINQPEVYARGMQLTENSKYLKEVRNNEFYKAEASKLGSETSKAYSDYMKHEALAMAIGDKGAQFVGETRKKDFKEWLNNLWNKIKEVAGFKDITASELQNLTFDEFTKRAAADILRDEEVTKPQVQQSKEEGDGSKTKDNTNNADPFSKENLYQQINELGKNNDDTKFDSILHRKYNNSEVETSEDAVADRLYLALHESDTRELIQKFKDQYEGKYLGKLLSLINGANKNKVSLENLLSLGIALENEIGAIRDGIIKNEFDISTNELSRVNSSIQNTNKLNARTGSKLLNISKLLYNWYDTANKYSKNFMTDSQQKESDNITDILENDSKLDESAQEYEEGKLENTIEDKPEIKKPKKVKETKQDSEIKKDLEQLKKDIEDLNC